MTNAKKDVAKKQEVTPKVKPKANPITYSIDEFVETAYQLGYKPELVYSALKVSGKEEYSKNEFDSIMKQFTKNL